MPDVDVALDVEVVDDYAFLANGNSGLLIVDVSNPASPSTVSSLGTPGSVYDVAVENGFAYLAAFNEGLRIIDVSNPFDPIELGYFNTSGEAHNVVVDGGYAYVADWGSGLRVIDVSSPSTPVETGYYDPWAITMDAVVADGNAFVAAQFTFLILDCNDAITPPLPPTVLDFSEVETSAGETVFVELQVIDFEDIAGIQLFFTYDPQILSFQDVTSSWFSNPTLNDLGGTVILLWDDFANPLTLPDNSSLLEVEFLTLGEIGEIGTIGWQPENCELVDDLGDPIPSVNYLPGSVSIVESIPLVSLDIIPWTEPIIIPPSGESFWWHAQISNNLSQSRQGQAWTEAILPNGSTYGPILLQTINLQPGQIIISNPLQQDVPGGAPAGVYTYICKLGIHPNFVVAEDSFQFTKELGSTTDADVSGWELKGQLVVSETTASKISITISPELWVGDFAPNPFNSATVFQVHLPSACNLSIDIYNVTGQHVDTITQGEYPQGFHSFTVDGNLLSSGLYFMKISTPTEMVMKKMMLLK